MWSTLTEDEETNIAINIWATSSKTNNSVLHNVEQRPPLQQEPIKPKTQGMKWMSATANKNKISKMWVNVSIWHLTVKQIECILQQLILPIVK